MIDFVQDYYRSLPIILQFPMGSLLGDIQCVDIALVSDALLEGPESFLVHQIASNDGISLNTNTFATVTIVDDGQYTVTACAHYINEAPIKLCYYLIQMRQLCLWLMLSTSMKE